jgi:hypothetical protein
VWTGLPLFKIVYTGHKISDSIWGEFVDQPNHHLLLKVDSGLLSLLRIERCPCLVGTLQQPVRVLAVWQEVYVSDITSLYRKCVNRIIFSICLEIVILKKQNCQRIMLCCDFFIFRHCFVVVYVEKHLNYLTFGNNGSVSVATRCGLDGPETDSWWERVFLYLSVPTLWPIQPPIQWVPGFFPMRWNGRDMVLTTHPQSSAGVKERVELYFYFPSGPSWPVLGRTLALASFSSSFCGAGRIPPSVLQPFEAYCAKPLISSQFTSRGAPRQTAWETSISERRKYGREMAGQI